MGYIVNMRQRLSVCVCVCMPRATFYGFPVIVSAGN